MCFCEIVHNISKIECVFVPSGGALGLLLGCCLGPLLLLGCFGFSFWVPLYTFCVLRGAFVRSLGCWFGFPLYT
jgi:hypothetical protein